MVNYGIREIKYNPDEVEFVKFRKKDTGQSYWNIPSKFKIEEVKKIVAGLERITQDIKKLIERGEFYDN